MTAQYRLRLLGSLQLFNRSGKEIAVKGAKNQGVLAILATSQGRPVERTTLQDLLWSDRGQRQGRESLKQSLTYLRKLFGNDRDDVLISTGGPIRLNMDAFEIDLMKPAKADSSFIEQEFLQGIDVRDPQFEDWLSQMRRSVDRKRHANLLVSDSGAQRQRYHLAIMPPAAVGNDDQALLFSGLALDRIALVLASHDVFKICDYRQATDSSARGADITLDTKVASTGDEVLIHLNAYLLPERELIWGARNVFPKSGFGSARMSALVSDVALALCEAVRKCEQLSVEDEKHRAARYAMEGIDNIFRLTTNNLSQASFALRKAVELDPKRSSYLAWYGFLAAFLLEDKKGANLLEIREFAREISEKAMQVDASNPLTRSLLTHLNAFVLNDFDAANALISPLKRSPPDTPFFAIANTFLNFYMGKKREALQAAVHLEQYANNPLAIPMLRCAQMSAAMINGDFKTAIEFGERVYALPSYQSHKYEPALRYLAIAHAKEYNLERSRELISQLKRQAPNAYHAELAEEAYMAPTNPVRDLFSNAKEVKKLFS